MRPSTDAAKAAKREEARATDRANDGTAELVDEVDRLLERGRAAVAEERGVLEELVSEEERMAARRKRDAERIAEWREKNRYEDRRSVEEQDRDRAAVKAVPDVEYVPVEEMGPDDVEATEGEG